MKTRHIASPAAVEAIIQCVVQYIEGDIPDKDSLIEVLAIVTTTQVDELQFSEITTLTRCLDEYAAVWAIHRLRVG